MQKFLILESLEDNKFKTFIIFYIFKYLIGKHKETSIYYCLFGFSIQDKLFFLDNFKFQNLNYFFTAITVAILFILMKFQNLPSLYQTNHHHKLKRNYPLYLSIFLF